MGFGPSIFFIFFITTMWGNTFFIGLDGWLLTNPVGVGFIAFDGSTAADTIIAIKPDPLDADISSGSKIFE